LFHQPRKPSVNNATPSLIGSKGTPPLRTRSAISNLSGVLGNAVNDMTKAISNATSGANSWTEGCLIDGPLPDVAPGIACLGPSYDLQGTTVQRKPLTQPLSSTPQIGVTSAWAPAPSATGGRIGPGRPGRTGAFGPSWVGPVINDQVRPASTTTNVGPHPVARNNSLRDFKGLSSLGSTVNTGLNDLGNVGTNAYKTATSEGQKAVNGLKGVGSALSNGGPQFGASASSGSLGTIVGKPLGTSAPPTKILGTSAPSGVSVTGGLSPNKILPTSSEVLSSSLPINLGRPLGIPAVDRVRELIIRGFWSQAQSELRGLLRASDGRTRALAGLYRAVVAAEAGLDDRYEDGTGRSCDADAGFRQAIEDLGSSAPADRLRAHQDYANFLLRQSQDRLSNHAFQMAAGVEHPLFTPVQAWNGARQQYEAARSLATAPEDRAAIDVSLARLYTLLTEIVATLDVPAADATSTVIRQAALRQGLDYASRAVAEQTGTAAGASTSGSFLLALAEETRAQLAFRQGNWKACQEQAELARSLYEQAGMLLGQESVHRLLGLCCLHAAEAMAGPAATASSQAALRHLLVSHALSEVLRQRFPADRAGLSRAGFFARRAYVTERIVELLLEEGKDEEALGYAETMKSRALQDVLQSRRLTASDATDQPETANILARWPRGVTALGEADSQGNPA
jgi:hypothetical protein